MPVNGVSPVTVMRSSGRRRRTSNRARVVLVIGALMMAPARAGESDSVIEIPVRLPLAPLFAGIERHVPREVRRDRGWEAHGGIEVRFAARRGALELYSRGDTIFLRTTVAYWLKARKRLLGRISVAGSCGIEEPPRLAVITLAARFGVRPDWRLGVEPAVLPPAFLNPCRMTVAGIDVTGALAQALQKRLWRAVTRELARVVAESGDGRKLAADIWSRLQSPLPLDDATWLVLKPGTVWATQPLVDSRAASLSIGLTARARLISGAVPAVDKVPLPVLRVAAPRSPVMRFPVRLAVDYADADAILRSRLAGQRFSWAGKTVLIEETRLVLDGAEDIAIEASVSGDLSGRLRVSGKPAYDAASRELYLADVGYQLVTEDAEVRRLEALFHELFAGVIAQRARWPLGERIREGQQQLEQAIDQTLPQHYRLRTSVDEIRLDDIRLSDSAIVIEGTVEGLARLIPD